MASCAPSLFPSREGWVGVFSHKRLPGTRALLSAQGPTARLILQVILRLQLTSSPHSQNNGAKGKGGTGESPGASCACGGQQELLQGALVGRGAGYRDGHCCERGFPCQVPPSEPPEASIDRSWRWTWSSSPLPRGDLTWHKIRLENIRRHPDLLCLCNITLKDENREDLQLGKEATQIFK